jgi:predicted nuclease of predicted toxin-antitoxin system
MKLLFDHHLSRKLVGRLADLFPQSSHVVMHGLDRAEDVDIWQFARDEGYLIVTKDSDFNDVVMLRGVPPKIIWIRVGNCTTATVETIIRRNYPLIEVFYHDPQSAILEIV